ncbi:trpS: tryptophan--tRNA ligase [Rubrobacter radiotolerans]|uniref:Tryptophan--tRNA ligase n=1 Tax=Rubrobacter radiotolerans TaxID=42256 RepID=A0A023X039_RUBRA|nr:tryptophan--tRNA ligase [Rubrobacter radiotolerans]AHY45419.1 trpS: tryptophan--tRNA ligase [Rubrobacter radiotolerans]MDX5892830.1 tryptophan--tRNA ligase [Rubrobacter radiotolerans]SMC02577.1 tryptophanyl-tRNA synthetase [Rubrobacter radiotolerans DSM 5868]
MSEKRQRVFSGIQPSGNLTIGNYLGALKNWVAIQEENENFFCIVDLHALTVPQDPKVLSEKIREVAAIYLAVGLDPAHCTIFRQSKVSGHAELAWLLNCVARFGELSRMTQFKDKTVRGGADSASAGLFTYPVLMAADILLYNANLVPVGDDQRQHLELTRTLARRFNHLYGETFVVPEGMILESGARVMGLDDPTVKMSKSSKSPGHYVAILDDPDVIRKKIRRAKTDSGTEVTATPDKPAITNLLDIYSATTGRSVPELESEYAGRGYGDLKKGLAEAIVETLAPIRERALALLDDPAELDRLLDAGAERAGAVASEALGTAKAKMGLG